MKMLSDGLIPTARRVALLVAWLLAMPMAFAANVTNPPPSAPFDYAKPALVTGTLYAVGSDRKNVLYTFRRVATRIGDTVHVRREFLNTNGTIVALEKIVYQSNRLVSLVMQEFQAKVSGLARIVPDPKNPGRRKLLISYGSGLTPPKGELENLPPDSVIDDNLYPFMVDHWKELMRGDSVKFHFISLEWRRTFAFELFKTDEFEEDGRTVERIEMKPVNFFIAEFFKPLVFIVDKADPHHVLSYLGRTTPRIKRGNSWDFLDADTVFHWK